MKSSFLHSKDITCKFVVVQLWNRVQLFCDPMNCSTPGFSILHCLPEFTQTHVHWVSDVIYHVILCPSLHPTLFSSCPQSFPASGSFPVFYMAIIWFYLYFCLLLMLLHIYSPLLSHKMLKLMKIVCHDPSFPFLSIDNLIYTLGFRNQHDCPWFISEICFDLFIELPT